MVFTESFAADMVAAVRAAFAKMRASDPQTCARIVDGFARAQGRRTAFARDLGRLLADLYLDGKLDDLTPR